LSWDGTALTIAIDEWTVPYPSRIKGRVRVEPSAFVDEVTPLDKDGRHGWLPIAPRARVNVAFEHPKLRWSGEGYLDSNFGDEPLEHAFKSWNWSRAHTRDATMVLYDLERRDGSMLTVARSFDGAGHVHNFVAPPETKLPPGALWRVSRQTRSDEGKDAELIKTLEDTPFYTRSLIEATLAGNRVMAFHESLSLDRVANPIVRLMLPFRMPRRRYRRPRMESG
jgi:carotenoid 1,2-hydratase